MFGLHFINEIEALQRQMNQAFQAMPGTVTASRDIALAMTEEETGYSVRATLPGLDVEKLDISILGRQLKISGDFTQEELPAETRWYRQERQRGHFEKVLQLSTNLDPEKVEAEYKHGILQIHLPKAESALPKKIAVNVA